MQTCKALSIIKFIAIMDKEFNIIKYLYEMHVSFLLDLKAGFSTRIYVDPQKIL